jgi:hypothetical protein
MFLKVPRIEIIHTPSTQWHPQDCIAMNVDKNFLGVQTHSLSTELIPDSFTQKCEINVGSGDSQTLVAQHDLATLARL